MKQGNKIILVLGILAVAAAGIVWLEASSFQKRAVVTEGKVVHVLGSSYRFQYFTKDGVEKIKYGSGKSHKFHEGDRITVWYTADKPDTARITDGKKGAKMILIAGICCIILGVYPLFLKKKEKTTA